MDLEPKRNTCVLYNKMWIGSYPNKRKNIIKIIIYNKKIVHKLN